MTQLTDRLLTNEQVLEIVGVSRATLFRMVKRGKFPQAIQVSERAVRWRESQVLDFIYGCPAAGGEIDDRPRQRSVGNENPDRINQEVSHDHDTQRQPAAQRS